MARLPLVPVEAFPPDLRDALDRGRASGMLSTPVPVQVWAHRPAVALAWLQALGAMHEQGLLDARLRELVRLKIASITTCRACQLARKSDSVTDADLACLGADSDRFTPREQAALHYAELFAGDYLAIDDTVFARLARHFTVPETVELNLFCALMLAGGRMTHVQHAYEEMPDMSDSLYDIPLRRIDGSPATLADYRDQVVLVVNVASKCGLTPQYEGLEKLYSRYREQGLQVLGFPSNDFGAQEPGTEAEILSFCQTSYGVAFPMFGKVNVNSEPRHPLYAALIAARPEATPSGDDKLRSVLTQHGLLPKNATDVMWNFEKFLIGRDGQVVGRFAPDVTPDSPTLVAAIEAALG